MPETDLTIKEQMEAVGKSFRPDPPAVVEEKVETPPEPEKTPEQVRQEKNDQMLAQVASSLKKLEERKEAHEADIAGRDKPLTVAQQEEGRVIKEKTERAIAKLRAISALPEDQANVHAERNDVLNAIDEHETELEKAKAEIAELKAMVQPMADEVAETRALKAMKAANPDAETDWEACVKEVLDFIGADPQTGAPPEGMTEKEVAAQIRARYNRVLAGKKKAPAAKKETPTAPRQTPKTPGGGSVVGAHSPGANGSGRITDADTPDFAQRGRDFRMGVR